MDANSMVDSVNVAKEVSRYCLEPEIIGALITGFFILVVALFSYVYGLRAYFKKREHEQIMKRYLEEGIDRFSERINHVTEIFLENYVKADEILSQLKTFHQVDLSFKFHTIPKFIGMTPVYKLFYLLGDDVFALSIQKLFVHIDSTRNFLDVYWRSLVSKAIKILQTHQEPTTLEQFAEELIKPLRSHLEEDYNKFEKFVYIDDGLQRIAAILEKETTITWSDLSHFRNRNDVEKIVATTKEKYDELKKERLSKIEQK